MSRFTHFSGVNSKNWESCSCKTFYKFQVCIYVYGIWYIDFSQSHNFMCLVFEVRASEVVNMVKVCNYLVNQYLLAFVTVSLQIFHRNKKSRLTATFGLWSSIIILFGAKDVVKFSSDSTSNPISSLQWSEFSPGTWLFCLRILLYLEPRLNGAGKLLYFTPILLEIATFHPHIGSQGKDFVASRLSGLENQSCLRRRGGMMMGAPQMDLRTNIMITCCMHSAYFNLMKWGLHFKRERHEGL